MKNTHGQSPQLTERIFWTAVWSHDGEADASTTVEYTIFPKCASIRMAKLKKNCSTEC